MIKRKTALVLSGGGARGIAHIGVIEELLDQGYEIHSVAGTSMGAFVGGMFAYGKLDEFKNWLFNLDKLKIFKLMDFSFNSQGLIKGDKIFESLKEIIPDSNIEDLPINFSATASDLTEGKEKIFTKGSLYKAIRASIAIPTVITPVKAGNSLLVDGGVLNNLPVSNVNRKRLDRLVVVNVNANVPVIKVATSKESKQKQSSQLEMLQKVQQLFKKEHKNNHEEKLGYLSLFDKTFHLMIHNVVSKSLNDHKPDLEINISRETCGTFDFLKAEELVEIGKIATRKVLDSK